MTETKPIQAMTEERAAALMNSLAALAAEGEKALRQFGASVHAAIKQTAENYRVELRR